MSSSSSHFRLHHFSLPLHEKPFLLMLGSVLWKLFFSSLTCFPFCLSFLSLFSLLPFTRRLEIFWPAWWISQVGLESFQGFRPFFQWCESGFRAKLAFYFLFSHHFQMFPFINILLPSRATPTFANKKNWKFIFHVREYGGSQNALVIQSFSLY